MPSSYYQPIPYILDRVLERKPTTILDIGVGFGKYGVVIRERLDIWGRRFHPEEWSIVIDGIEGFEGYNNPIHNYVYNKVHYGKVEEVLPSLGMYDIALFIDVLEHFEKEDGLRILQTILDHTKTLIISTPIRVNPQGPYMGNELELHKSQWSEGDFKLFNPIYHIIPIGKGGAQIILIGE
jgi:hypothetical protein